MDKLKNGIIVSCQPDEFGLFSRTEFIVEFAIAAELGGATGIRTEGLENIKAVKDKVKIPVIGLIKGKYPDGSVLITPDVEAVQKVIESGARTQGNKLSAITDILSTAISSSKLLLLKTSSEVNVYIPLILQLSVK